MIEASSHGSPHVNTADLGRLSRLPEMRSGTLNSIAVKYRRHENTTTFPACPGARQRPPEDDPNQLGDTGWSPEDGLTSARLHLNLVPDQTRRSQLEDRELESVCGISLCLSADLHDDYTANSQVKSQEVNRKGF